MNRIRITINGNVEFDGDLGEWVNTPPDFIRDRLKPGTVVQPHMKMVMIAMTEAMMAGVPIDITAETDKRGYTLSVREF